MSTDTKTSPAGIRLCLCGCREHVAGKANYRPGHDARHVSRIGADLFNRGLSEHDDEWYDTLSVLPSTALVTKATRYANNLYEKANKARVKAEAQVVEQARAQAVPVQQDGTVKIGRWTYPARKVDDIVVRNVKRDGSSDEWIPAGPNVEFIPA